MDIIYLDLTEALKKVNLGLLLHKLKDLGIKGKVKMWMHDLLANCKQKVIINGYSNESSVRSGVSPAFLPPIPCPFFAVGVLGHRDLGSNAALGHSHQLN